MGQAGRDRDHRQPGEARGVLRDVDRPAAADPDQRVVEPRRAGASRAPSPASTGRPRRPDLPVGQLRAQVAAISSPGPGPTTTATCPPLEIRRSASSGASAVDRPRPDVDRQRRADHAGQQRHATSRARARSAWSSTSTHSTAPIGAIADAPAAVGELLEAVLVVERRVAPPRRLERVGQRLGGRAARSASRRCTRPCAVAGSSALLMRSRQPVRRDVDLHLLVAERLARRRRRSAASGAARGQQRLLDRRGMHRVAVGQQHALGEVLARAPQRVGVVPLERLRVEQQLELDARGGARAPARARRCASCAKPVTTTPRRARPASSCRARRRGSCGRRRRPAASWAGSSVSGASRVPAPAASTMPITRPRPPRPRTAGGRAARRERAPSRATASPTNSGAEHRRQRRSSPPGSAPASSSTHTATSRPSQPQRRGSPSAAASRRGGAGGRRGRSGGRRAPPSSANAARAARARRRAPPIQISAAYSTARSSGGTAQRRRSACGRPLDAPPASTSPGDRGRGDARPTRRRRAIAIDARAAAATPSEQQREPAAAGPRAERRPSARASGPSSR